MAIQCFSLAVIQVTFATFYWLKNPHDYESVLRVWGNATPLLHTRRGRELVPVLRYTHADPSVNYSWCHFIDELNVLRAGYMFTKQQCWAWPKQHLCGTHHLTTVLCCGVPLHWEPKWWSKIAWITLGNGAGGLLRFQPALGAGEGCPLRQQWPGSPDPGRVLRRYGRAVPSTGHQGWRYGMEMECPFTVWPDPTEPSATPSAFVGVPDLATNLRFTLEAASVNWTGDTSPLLLTALYSTWFLIMGWGWGLLFPACWSLRSQTMGIIFTMLEYLTLLT